MIGCYDDPRVRRLLTELDCNTISYGLEAGADWQAYDISYDDLDHPSFKLSYRGRYLDTFSIRLAGKHNILNSLAAIIAASTIGIDKATIKKGPRGL